MVSWLNSSSTSTIQFYYSVDINLIFSNTLCRYSGPTLIEVIDNFKCPERPVDKPFRFSINDIFKNTGSGFSISGHMETGMVSVGDKVLILPRNETAIVKGLYLM